MKRESLHVTNNAVMQKMAYTGHVLRSSSGSNALLLLEEKFEETKKGGSGRSK